MPEWSDIQFRDATADDMHVVEGVPDESEALTLATNLFPKLGIDPTQLAKQPGGADLRTSSISATATLYPKGGGPAYATNLHMRGVIFMRALDGVPIYGMNVRGGCCIQFGHHANIAEISISWRKVQRHKLHPVAGTKALLKSVRAGKAVWQTSSDWPNPDWSSATKLTITNATPFYYAEGRGEFDKPLNQILPFIQLQAVFDVGHTNIPIMLNCPAFEEEGISLRQ